MKNRVLTFIIGILVGAILATVGFNLYSKSMMNNRWMMRPGMNMNEGGMPPEMPNGQGRGGMRGNGERPQNNNVTEENNKGE